MTTQESNTVHEPDSYYIDPNNQERLRLQYQVILTRPATCIGVADVEESSENEAVQLALADPWTDGYWEVEQSGNEEHADVCEVQCHDVPDDAVLMGTSRSDATLDEGFDWPSSEIESTEDDLNGSNDKG